MILLLILTFVFLPHIAFTVFLRTVSPSRAELETPYDSFEKHAADSYQLWIYGVRGKKVAKAILHAIILGSEIVATKLDPLEENDLFTLEGTYKGAPLMFSYSQSMDLNKFAQ